MLLFSQRDQKSFAQSREKKIIIWVNFTLANEPCRASGSVWNPRSAQHPYLKRVGRLCNALCNQLSQYISSGEFFMYSSNEF